MDAQGAETLGIASVLGGAGDGTGQTPGGAPEPVAGPDEAVAARVEAALTSVGRAASLAELHREANEGSTHHLAEGVVLAALERLTEAGRVETSQSTDSPPVTLYALATPKAPAFVDLADGLPVEARAAVVAVLGGNVCYGTLDGRPTADVPFGGFDLTQIGLVLASAAKDGETALIAVPPAFVTAFTTGLDLATPGPAEDRISSVLSALAATTPPLVATAQSEDDPPMTLYRLTAAGQIGYAERGALALAEATMPPKPAQPSAEERLTQVERSFLEREGRMLESHNKAVAQRNEALQRLAQRDLLIAQYRNWFLGHKLEDPDAIVGAKPRDERTIIKGYVLDLDIDLQEHLRILDEWRGAEVEHAELVATQGEQVAAMKAAKQASENKVAGLKNLAQKPPGQGEKHTVVKDVWKAVEGDQMTVYSADSHDYGKVLARESIPRGTQNVIAATGVPVVPADPPKKKDAKKGASASTDAATQDATSATKAAPTTTEEPGPDFAGVVRSQILAHPGSTIPDIATRLAISVMDVSRAIATLGDTVVDTAGAYRLKDAPPKKDAKAEEKPDAPPKADPDKPSKALDAATIDANVVTMLKGEPYARTGVQKGDFANAYAAFVDLKATASVAKIVNARLTVLLERGTIAQGEGGDDTSGLAALGQSMGLALDVGAIDR